MAIQTIESEDFVNQGRDKFNESLGEVPVGFELLDGVLVITKHNTETIEVPLKNFFAQLTTIFDSISVDRATSETPGTVLLVDDEDPAQAESESRVFSAAQITALLDALALTGGSGPPSPTINDLLRATAVVENIVMAGPLANIVKVLTEGQEGETGLYIDVKTALNELVKHSFFAGRFGDGKVGFSSGDDGGRVALAGRELYLEASTTYAQDVQARRIGFASLPLTELFESVFVPVYDPARQRYDQKAVGLAELSDSLLPYLRAQLTGTVASDDDWEVTGVCEFVETIPPPPYQNLLIPTPVNGQTVPHKLFDTDLWVTATSNTGVGVSFPDADHLQLYVPEGVELPELIIKIEPKNT